MREKEYWILLENLKDISKAGIKPNKVSDIYPYSGIVKAYWGHGYKIRASRQLTTEEDVNFIMQTLKKRGVTPIGIMSG